MSNELEYELGKVLCSIYHEFEEADFSPQQYNKEVHRVLNRFTLPDENHSDFLEYGQAISNVNPDKNRYGFKINGKRIFLDLLLNDLEHVDIPESIKENYPDMSNKEWCAAMRLAGVIVGAFSLKK